MNSIQIDDQVLAELERRATGFHVSPNDVLRRILNLPAGSAPQAMQKDSVPPTSPPDAIGQSPLIQFIGSEKFPRHGPVVDRFRAILGWLYNTNPTRFADIADNFQRGQRCHFAKSRQEIEKSGANITAQSIPQSPYWVLTTLDSRTKRTILEDVLRAFGHSRGDINLVLATLPDASSRNRRMEAILREFGKSN